MLKIGIDVGGTNTDGVLIKDDIILQKIKMSTKTNIAATIVDVIKKLLAVSSVPTSAVDFVMIGTTHFLNAFLQQKNISKVSVVRLCLPTASFLPPFIDWPTDINVAIKDHYYFVHGGCHINGKPISPLNESEIVDVAKKIQATNAQAVAISMPFSFINNEMELIAKDIIRQFNPDIVVSCSHQFPQAGLLERENSTIINASLIDYAKSVLGSIEKDLLSLLTNATIYFSGNDGTLLNINEVMLEPIRTFASGPTNSMRGAFILTGLKNTMVVDVGGTSTDIGVLINGFPRKRAIYSNLCGIRGSFSIPDVLSIPLGGGTIVKDEGSLKIGPESVGSRLEFDARCFGGSSLTLTDIYYADGQLELPGALSPQKIKIEKILKHTVIARVQKSVTQAINQMKSSKSAVPLVIIGGGAYMIPKEIPGVTEIIKPGHYEVANAVGAAAGDIAGEGNSVFDYNQIDRHAAINQLKETAFNQAVQNDADRDTLEVMEIQEIPIPYMPGSINKVHVKVIGKLKARQRKKVNSTKMC